MFDPIRKTKASEQNARMPLLCKTKSKHLEIGLVAEAGLAPDLYLIARIYHAPEAEINYIISLPAVGYIVEARAIKRGYLVVSLILHSK